MMPWIALNFKNLNQKLKPGKESSHGADKAPIGREKNTVQFYFKKSTYNAPERLHSVKNDI